MARVLAGKDRVNEMKKKMLVVGLILLLCLGVGCTAFSGGGAVWGQARSTLKVGEDVKEEQLVQLLLERLASVEGRVDSVDTKADKVVRLNEKLLTILVQMRGNLQGLTGDYVELLELLLASPEERTRRLAEYYRTGRSEVWARLLVLLNEVLVRLAETEKKMTIEAIEFKFPALPEEADQAPSGEGQ